MRSLLTQDGFTALHLAARNGHVDGLNVLITAGADKEARSKVRHPVSPEAKAPR